MHAGRFFPAEWQAFRDRLDVSSPLDGAWHIHRAWPGSELIVVDDEGHGGRSIVDTCRRILAEI